MNKGNSEAFNHLAVFYAEGINGMPQDRQKANELYLKAGELGCADGYFNLGMSYDQGRGVGVDMKKAKHYFELAAMNGHVQARYNIGCLEGEAGNDHRALKHFILAARAGFEMSLDMVKRGFMTGMLTQDEYANILRAYHERQKEMKNDVRDKAEAAKNHVLAQS